MLALLDILKMYIFTHAHKNNNNNKSIIINNNQLVKKLTKVSVKCFCEK